jgi:hypothetical protein
MVPHVLAPVLAEPAADALAVAELAAAAEPVPALDAGAEFEELDEPDEQAARPRPATRARAAMPPVCTALMMVSFDTVVAVANACFG